MRARYGAFRESLKEPSWRRYCERLNQALAGLGVPLKSGQIIDASFVPVPVQRNGREENALIMQGAVPLEWGQNPQRVAHKDVDARWMKKNDQSHFGYKNHVNADKDTKLIAKQTCTDASVHDSQVLDEVVRPPQAGGESVWADSAYRSEEQEQRLADSKHHSQVHERAIRPPRCARHSKPRTKPNHAFAPGSNTSLGTWRTAWAGCFCAPLAWFALRWCGLDESGLQLTAHRGADPIRSKVFSSDRITASAVAAVR